MKHACKAIFLIVFATLLGGCASTPSNYYTLIPVSSEATSTHASDRGEAYVLGDVTIPADVDQPTLVVQDRDGRVLMLEYDRWASPLAAQFQNALSKQLGRKIGFPPLQDLNLAFNDKRYTRVRVAIRSFELMAGQYAAISATWQLSYAGSDKTLSCTANLRHEANVGVSALVLAQQSNVSMLSDLIAQALTTKSAPAGSVCFSL